MKILFGIQGTGNGHISRAREVVPLLQQYGELDLIISGTEAEVGLSQPVKHQFHGLSFIFGKKGGIDYWATYKQMNWPQFFKDKRNLKLDDYDLIVNDFEPVSAWACHNRGIPSVSLSHQCSFQSANTPRVGHSRFAEFLFNYYSPTTHHIGFHFERYDDFIHTPVIRSEIRQMETSNKGHYSVYLPAYDDKLLAEHLKKTDVEWNVFSKREKTAYRDGNVNIIPVDNAAFNTSLATGAGLLTGGGFEGPAEALFLGKKVMMIPMKGQYEQQCNALSASKLGVPVVHEINDSFGAELEKWLNTPNNIKVNFPDETAQIVDDMVKKYAR